MKMVIMVGLGGFCGAIGRYLLSGWVQKHWQDLGFPLGTLAVNLLGCLLIGFFAGLVEHRQMLGPELRAFLLVGIFGGFTTFSTFGLESFHLLRDGNLVRLALYVTLHLFAGLLMVLLGQALARW